MLEVFQLIICDSMHACAMCVGMGVAQLLSNDSVATWRGRGPRGGGKGEGTGPAKLSQASIPTGLCVAAREPMAHPCPNYSFSSIPRGGDVCSGGLDFSFIYRT